MIIGSGDIAKALVGNELFDSYIYFASGVSDSSCTDRAAFDREIALLLMVMISAPKDSKLIYFSSLSIYYSKSEYAQHKILMEGLVRTIPNHCIVRLGNITWGENPKTLINYLKNRIKNNEPYDVLNVSRFICDKDEFLFWMDTLKTYDSRELNITGEKLKVSEIVDRIKGGAL